MDALRMEDRLTDGPRKSSPPKFHRDGEVVEFNVPGSSKVTVADPSGITVAVDRESRAFGAPTKKIPGSVDLA